MKLATLIALALLPIALGTPVSNDTSVTDKPHDGGDVDAASTEKWRVTAHSLACNAKSSSGSDSKTKLWYQHGDIITAECWVTGETVRGNYFWDWTSDGCYVSEYWIEYVSGTYGRCRGDT